MQQEGLKKNDILKNIEIEKLVFGGKGFARLKHTNPDLDGRVIFVTGGAIPGTIANLRVLKKRQDYIETQIVDIIKKSPLEQTHPTNKYGMSGGWKWINIPYEQQLNIKNQQVKESIFHLKKLQENLDELFLDIQGSPIVDGYRNKVEFSFGKNISAKFNTQEHFNVGFHKQAEFSKVEDFDGCPLIDDFQNKIYLEIKNFCKKSGLPVYDAMRNEGFFRHLLIRKTHFSDQMMIILGFNPDFFEKKKLELELEKINNFLLKLAEKYKNIKSIYLSYNKNKADIAIGDLKLIYGNSVISEELLGLKFNISPNSFFQTNSSGAEKLYSLVLDFAHKQNLSKYKVLDLYAGTGTIGMIFAKAGAKEVTSVEMVKQASNNGIENAKINKLNNINFVCAKVEDFLKEYLNNKNKADLLIIDPPRAGMHPDALINILKFNVNQIIYVSCNPSTLSRDLGYILKNSDYKIEKIQAMDMFPHTHHIETIVSLIKN